jgi:hypothetical protein
MDFKSLLSQLDQLTEATEKTKTGVRHTAEPGGYGRKDDEDDEGNKVKQDTAPRGRGRPKKATSTSGEDKKYDFSAFGVTKGKDVKLPKHDKKKTTKHSIKEYIDQLEKALTEAEQIQIKPASQMPKKPGQTSQAQPGQPQQVQGQAQQNTQVIAQGDKTLGTVNNPQLAQQIKQSIGKGEMTLMPDQQVNELDAGTVARYQDKAFDKYMGGDEKRAQGLDRASKKQAGAFGHVPTTQKVNEKDIGKHNNATTGFDALVRKLTPKYGKEAATKIAGAQMKKIKEADQPPRDALASPLTFEAKKPDANKNGIPDYAEDGKGKNDLKKKKVKEGITSMKNTFAILDDNLIDQIANMNGAEVDPDAGTVETWDENTFRQLNAFAQKNPSRLKRTQSMNTAGMRPMARQVGGTATGPEYNLKEGMMDKLKSMLVPKLMKLLGPDAEKIASAVKQATGGDLTPSKENAMKVVQALGIDKAAAQGQSPQMAEGIAGNWQGKLIQALYTLGLLGSAGAAASMYGTVGGSFMGVIGVLLLMFANTVFGDAPGQTGTMGNFGNKGTDMNAGLDDHGMPIRTRSDTTTNPYKGQGGFQEQTDLDRMMEMAGAKKKEVKEGMNTRLKAARHAGKSHALGKQGYNCSYDDMEESRHYHEGYKEGLDECYGQMPIQGYVGEVEGSMPAATVPGMASQEQHGGMDEGNAFTAALKRTPTGGKFSVGGDTYTDRSSIEESPFAFEALDKQLNALLESKEDVAEGMTVSISKGQQGSPDSVSVSAQDAEADQLLGLIKSAGLGLFGGDDTGGYGAPQGGQPQHGGLDVVGDHDGMMALIKKVTGGEAGNGDYADEEGHADEHGHEGACESCGGMMEAGHACGEGQQMVDEVESEDQMTYQMAEDNPPDSGADNTNAAIADTAQANQAGAAYNPKNDVDEGAGGPEASEEPVEKLTPDEEDQSDEEGEKEKSAEEEDKADKESMSESMFVNLYKKLTLISEESTSEKDDKAEKAAKKVAKDIEYDEDHKGKDDDKAEEAGKKVKKDIEYDDKKDKKKIDEWANDAGPGKSASDTAFETDIDFMMNVISGGLNKRKQTGQTTIPVIAGQNRTTSRNTTDINESKYSSDDAVSQWKKLAGLK